MRVKRGDGRVANVKAGSLAVVVAGLLSRGGRDPCPAQRAAPLPQSCGHLVTCSSKSQPPWLTAKGTTSGSFAPGARTLPEAQAPGCHLFPSWVIMRPVGGRRCWTPPVHGDQREGRWGGACLQKSSWLSWFHFSHQPQSACPHPPCTHGSGQGANPLIREPGVPGEIGELLHHSGFERRWVAGTLTPGAASRAGLGPRSTPVPASPFLQGTATSVPGPPLACSPWPTATA